MLALLPLVAVQAIGVRRRVERLPEAAGTEGQIGGNSAAVREIRIIGDSVAAGVGVEHHRDTLAGQLAALWQASTGDTVRWQTLARSGRSAADVADVLASAPDTLRGADVVVLSVGVNDVKDLRTDDQWTTGLTGCLDLIAAAAPSAHAFVLGLPPVELLPALPRPLADLLGARGRRLERLGRELCASRMGVHHVELGHQAITEVTDAFARDGFHPSAEVHRLLAEQIHGRLVALEAAATDH